MSTAGGRSNAGPKAPSSCSGQSSTSVVARPWLCLPAKGTDSNGSSIGQQSSQVTGNGGWVGGNIGPDQATYPGSRAALVHASNTCVAGQHNK